MPNTAGSTSGADLITAFFEEATNAFKPLVERGRGKSSRSLMRMTASGDLEPTTPDAITGLSFVRDIGSALRTPEPIIASPSREVRDRVAVARQAFQDAQVAERREYEHRSAVAKANEAFRKQEWKQVVALLTPVEDCLLPGEAAKLRYARRGQVQ